MRAFKYKGYDSHGEKTEGEIQAETIEEAERRLAAQAMTIISILPAGVNKERFSGDTPSTTHYKTATVKVKDTDLAGVLRDLAVMAEAGVPFVEALDAAITSATKNNVRNALMIVREQVVGGKSLSAALRASEGMFPEIICDMIKVAEQGGRLDKTLASAASYTERSAELRKKVMNAMLYPIVLTSIAVITIVVLVVFVLPKFAGVFENMGAEVPKVTQYMLSASEIIQKNPWVSLVGFVGVIFAIRALWRSSAFQSTLGSFLIRVPVLGELLIKISLSRSLESIATLLSTNVSLISALEHGARVAGNPVIEGALMHARSRVEHGGSLSEALIETKALPASVIQMVAVGERTGRLSHLMANTANHMQEEADNRLKALVALVEPVMIVVMGSIVGLITLSVVLPIYTVIQNIK